MKIYEILAAQKILSELNRPLHVKFGYGVAKNMASFGVAMKAIDASRTELIRRFAKVDEKGDPVRGRSVDGEFVDDTNGGEFQILDVTGFSEEMQKLLETELPCDVHRVDLDHFPEGLTWQQMAALMPMVLE